MPSEKGVAETGWYGYHERRILVGLLKAERERLEVIVLAGKAADREMKRVDDLIDVIDQEDK